MSGLGLACLIVFKEGKTMKAENYKKPIIIRKIRDKVWQRFRQICAAHDISANKNVIKLITEYVEKMEESCNSKE